MFNIEFWWIHNRYFLPWQLNASIKYIDRCPCSGRGWLQTHTQCWGPRQAVEAGTVCTLAAVAALVDSVCECSCWFSPEVHSGGQGWSPAGSVQLYLEGLATCGSQLWHSLLGSCTHTASEVWHDCLNGSWSLPEERRTLLEGIQVACKSKHKYLRRGQGVKTG